MRSTVILEKTEREDIYETVKNGIFDLIQESAGELGFDLERRADTHVEISRDALDLLEQRAKNYGIDTSTLIESIVLSHLLQTHRAVKGVLSAKKKTPFTRKR